MSFPNVYVGIEQEPTRKLKKESTIQYLTSSSLSRAVAGGDYAEVRRSEQEQEDEEELLRDSDGDDGERGGELLRPTGTDDGERGKELLQTGYDERKRWR
ncbi:unnamed protein product [Linum trigynum]|uniref:Uncharacterized protein n=1 Tax=Linum trigynum TaxID=586398 RepID=A0AAV2G0Y3_9ROSI